MHALRTHHEQHVHVAYYAAPCWCTWLCKAQAGWCSNRAQTAHNPRKHREHTDGCMAVSRRCAGSWTTYGLATFSTHLTTTTSCSNNKEWNIQSICAHVQHWKNSVNALRLKRRQHKRCAQQKVVYVQQSIWCLSTNNFLYVHQSIYCLPYRKCYIDAINDICTWAPTSFKFDIRQHMNNTWIIACQLGYESWVSHPAFQMTWRIPVKPAYSSIRLAGEMAHCQTLLQTPNSTPVKCDTRFFVQKSAP